MTGCAEVMQVQVEGQRTRQGERGGQKVRLRSRCCW